MTSADLVAIADDLYAEPVASFTVARDAVVKGCTDKALAVRIKGLKKPSLAAWALNLLVRREADQIDQVLELAASLRIAADSLDGDGLRTLTRQRRQLTAALATTAGQLVREYGARLTPAVADQVEGMLTAAMLDPTAAEVVRSGMVVTAFTSTGVSELDPELVCAVPEALGHRAAAVQPAAPILHVVPDHEIRVEAAQERVEEAELGLAEATQDLAELEARSANLQARQLQLQGEIDELRRRLSGLEDDVENLDEEMDEVAEAAIEATESVRVADQDLDKARAELVRLEDRARG
jgi:DNA repair exonuclease SbcCD ATPase subunit